MLLATLDDIIDHTRAFVTTATTIVDSVLFLVVSFLFDSLIRNRKIRSDSTMAFLLIVSYINVILIATRFYALRFPFYSIA